MQSRSGRGGSRFGTLSILTMVFVISLVLPASGSSRMDGTDTSEAVGGYEGLVANHRDGYRVTNHELPGKQVRSEVAEEEDELIALWHFDEGSGDVAYDAVNGHDATLANVAWDPDGYTGSCLAFDGEASLASVPHAAVFDSLETLDLSFYLWLDSVATGDEDRIVMKGHYGADYLKVSFWNEDSEPAYMRRRILFVLKRGSTVTSTHSEDELESETWHFVQVTYDGVTMRIFIDGELSGSWVSLGRMPMSQTDPLVFGEGFSGKLDEVRLAREPSSLIQVYLPTIAREG